MSGPDLGQLLKKTRPDMHVMLMSARVDGNLLVLNYGLPYTVCPETQRDDVSFATCKLCAWKDRDVIIRFPEHGTKKYSVNGNLIQQGDLVA